MKELFFTKVPSVLQDLLLLDLIDEAIILRIKNSPKGMKRISYRDLSKRLNFSTGKSIGLGVLQYSIQKLIYMGIVEKEGLKKSGGQDGVNLYIINDDRNKWRLYHTARAVVNKAENLRDLPLSSNPLDHKDHFHWVCEFERTLPKSLRKYIDENGKLKKNKISELDKISKEADILNRIEAGENMFDSPLSRIEDFLSEISKPEDKKIHLKSNKE